MRISKFLMSLLLLLPVISFAQPNLWTYSPCGATCTTPSFTAVNTVGSSITYSYPQVNTLCGSGGLSNLVNNGVTTYSPSNLKATFKITPNVGYSLNVTGFTSTLRRSNSGLQSVRFAYSLDNGATWITNGVDQAIPNSGCGGGGPVNWTSFTPVNVTSTTNGIIFAIFAFNPIATNGNFQINAINVTGSVVPAGCTAPTLSNVTTNVSCFGGTNGAIDLTTTGGSSPFTYAWTGPGSFTASTQDISGRPAGTYSVTVTATGGCTTSTTVTITQPTQVTASVGAPTNVLCNGGNTGSATVTPGGGAGSYTYSWAPSGGTGATATGLGAGSYTVTVTDMNGCTATQSVTITEPGVLNVSTVSTTDVTCNGGNNGAATVSSGGGTPGYTYSWAPSGGTDSTATGLSAGPYTVTVTDANGCTATQSVSITEPSPINITVIGTTDASCNGGTNGSAAINVSGGAGGYTYNWSPSGGNSNVALNLGVGTYTATVTDASGCTATQSVSITEPSSIDITVTGTTDVSCNGGTTGSAAITVSGGTGGYTYSWSPSGGNSSTALNLGAGSYTVTVSDMSGCTATDSVAITEPTLLTATMSAVNDATCGQSNGAITVTANGGTAAYSYTWSPSGGTDSTATGLSSGTYTVLITDANGCTVTDSATVTDIAGPTVAINTTTPVSCFGGSDGSAVATGNGGTGAYTYSWSPSGGSSDTASALGTGTYTVTITDMNGCSASTSTTITEPSAVTSTISSSTDPGCFGGSNGSATVQGGGGTGSYSYAWSPSGGNGTTATGLSAGTYTATVTDANGCTATTSVTLTSPVAIIPAITATTNTTCFGSPDGSATVSASGGTPGYSYVWSPSGGTGVTATGLTAGTYTVTVTDAHNCTATTTATITQPSAIIATISSMNNVTCNGGNDGSATVSASGGNGGYIYNWSPSGGTGTTASSLSGGSYTVTVTDGSGCSTTTSAFISQPSAIVMNATVNSPVCTGDSIVLTGTAAGGQAPLSYDWDGPGGFHTTQLSSVIFPADASDNGYYYFTVTDNNNCSHTDSVDVIVGNAVLATGITVVNISDSTFQFTADNASGATFLLWTWGDGHTTGGGLTTVVHAYDTCGIFNVSLTLSNSCTSSTLTTQVEIDCQTQGVNNWADAHVNVYPNPTHDLLNIYVSEGTAITEARLTDMNGRLVMVVNTGNIQQLQLEGIAPGIYQLALFDGLAQVYTGKVIKLQ